MHGNGLGRGALPLGNVELGALEFGITIVIAPFPSRDGKPDRVPRCADAHVGTSAAPCDGPHIGIRPAVGLEHLVFRGFDFFDGVGDNKVEIFGGFPKTLGMFDASEDLAIVAPLAFENRRGVVHRVGQQMDVGIAPVSQPAIHPDYTVAIVVCAVHLKTFPIIARGTSETAIKLRLNLGIANSWSLECQQG